MTTNPNRGVLGDYAPEMTQQLAEVGVRAAQQKAKEAGGTTSVVVVDAAGHLVMFVRADKRGVYSFEMTFGRASSAAALRRRTVELEGLATPINPRWVYYQNLIQTFVPVPGGCPVAHDGKIIGAIGCGGDTAEQDQASADFAAAEMEKAYAKIISG